MPAAYKFIQFLTEGVWSPFWAAFASKYNLLPTRRSAHLNAAVKKNAIISAFLDQMLVARARPVLPEGGAIYTDFTPNVQKVLLAESASARV